MKRSSFLKSVAGLASTAVMPSFGQTQLAGSDAFSTAPVSVRKIATEEAFNIPEIAAAIKDLLQEGGTNLDNLVLKQIYDSPAAQSPSANIPASDRDRSTQTMLPRLLDLERIRLADMEASGVDMHVLSLTMPGVQIFERGKATQLATMANDQLAEAVRRHPTRFAGLACFAPQAVVASVKEMERSIKTLRLSGFILNSHTNNEYLDDENSGLCWKQQKH